MNIELFDFEKESISLGGVNKLSNNDNDINMKYEKGEARIVTEQGSYKLPLLKNIFKQNNYKLRPDFQRRITWDEKKRSKLIESFIMNIPIPPVFIYEKDFDKYEVMDGLQRISAIIAFYEDEFELVGLEEWSELNGRKYSTLPQKIKEGIDRRQLPVITLLKESAKTSEQAQIMKKMVFERLNTGGVQLKDQEVRNALYDGKFNKLCIKLSENETYRKLWGIIEDKSIDDDEEINSLDDAVTLAKNKLYKRMYDVELVLRFFAMRHLNEYNMSLSKFLDYYLQKGNAYDNDNLTLLSELFEETIQKADYLFGNKAFCQYTNIRGKKMWSSPQNMIYDAMMLALTSITIDVNERKNNQDQNILNLQNAYESSEDLFNGKKQSKTDISERADYLSNLIYSILQ